MAALSPLKNSGTDKSSNQSSPQSTKRPARIYEYDYTNVHADLETNISGGAYGGNNGCYLGIAEKIPGVDLGKFHTKRTKDEFYLPEMKELLFNNDSQKYRKRIVTFNPFGIIATNPTWASTTNTLYIPKFQDPLLQPDEQKEMEEEEEQSCARL